MPFLILKLLQSSSTTSYIYTTFFPLFYGHTLSYFLKCFDKNVVEKLDHFIINFQDINKMEKKLISPIKMECEPLKSLNLFQ